MGEVAERLGVMEGHGYQKDGTLLSESNVKRLQEILTKDADCEAENETNTKSIAS